ncbi:hypothetical protein GCM10027592_58280 [Spirosoma flavus]
MTTTDTEATINDWVRAKAYTKEYLEAMPEEGYALKPTPDIRSFAEQMLHLTDLNYALASAASGEQSLYELGELEKMTQDKSKENITRIVLDGYDFVYRAVKKMVSAQLSESVKVFGRYEMSRVAALAKGFEHQTHHRGQTTIYLRLAGVIPPKEKLF